MVSDNPPNRVNQAELARDLCLTDRRVRQLVEERIVPRARDEGFDLELCRRRYQLYRSGSDREWDAAFDEASDLANTAYELHDKAYSENATVDDVKAASEAIQASMSIMSFLTAAKSKSQSERQLFFCIWDREENRSLGALLARGMELLGKTHLRTDEGQLIEVNPPAPRVNARRARGRFRATGERK